MLSEEEKEYLSNIIKPFRSKVKDIQRFCNSEGIDWITIYFLDNRSNDLPYLKDFNNLKFKGMIENKHYTLKELGLEE